MSFFTGTQTVSTVLSILPQQVPYIPYRCPHLGVRYGSFYCDRKLPKEEPNISILGKPQGRRVADPIAIYHCLWNDSEYCSPKGKIPLSS